MAPGELRSLRRQALATLPPYASGRSVTLMQLVHRDPTLDIACAALMRWACEVWDAAGGRAGGMTPLQLAEHWRAVPARQHGARRGGPCPWLAWGASRLAGSGQGFSSSPSRRSACSRSWRSRPRCSGCTWLQRGAGCWSARPVKRGVRRHSRPSLGGGRARADRGPSRPEACCGPSGSGACGLGGGRRKQGTPSTRRARYVLGRRTRSGTGCCGVARWPRDAGRSSRPMPRRHIRRCRRHRLETALVEAPTGLCADAVGATHVWECAGREADGGDARCMAGHVFVDGVCYPSPLLIAVRRAGRLCRWSATGPCAHCMGRSCHPSPCTSQAAEWLAWATALERPDCIVLGRRSGHKRLGPG